MLTTQSCSSFSLKKYQHQGRGWMERKLTSFSSRRRGSFVPFQVPVHQVQTILNGKHALQSFGYCSPRFSALANNQGNIENLPLEQYRLEHDLVPKSDGGHQRSMWTNISKKLSALFMFIGPTGLSFFGSTTISVSLLPLETMADLSSTFFMGLLKAMIANLLMLIYVEGVNQLCDIEIDKVNKPYLPLASGDLSMATGVAIIGTSCILSFAMGFMSKSPWLLCGLASSFLYGTIYSIDDVPFLRWKKDPLLAMLIMTLGWGLGLQIPFFLHFQKFILGKPMVLKKSLIFSVAMMSLLSFFLSLTKDIPDVDGDKANGVDTFAIRLGVKRVFSIAVNMLLMGYGIAMIIGASSSLIACKLITVLGHFTLAFALWVRANSTDVTNHSSATSFYKFVWKLLYAELILVPFVR